MTEATAACTLTHVNCTRKPSWPKITIAEPAVLSFTEFDFFLYEIVNYERHTAAEKNKRPQNLFSEFTKVS